MSPEFEAIRAGYIGRDGITEKKMFGATGLHVNTKCFAMEYKGELVVKLPAARVDALVAEGVAERFDPGHGRRMKEWAAVPAVHSGRWPALSAEAHDFLKALG